MPCLALDARGGIAIPLRYVSGLEAVAQRIRIRLTTATGEWITDTAFGLPYSEWASGTRTGPTPDELAALVREQVERVPGVVRVLDADGRQDGMTVSLTVRVLASEDGESGEIEAIANAPLSTSGAPAWYVTHTGSRPAARR